MPLIPNHFLFRLSLPCRHVPGIPAEGVDDLFDLPEDCRLDNFADLDEKTNFADVRLAWNEFGLAVQVTVRGKEKLPVGDLTRPRQSDGLTLWIDTRDSRGSHRASRYCHQFHFLAAGGGSDRDEPAVAQSKINRALGDAPLVSAAEVPFRYRGLANGYRLSAFLPAAVLNGFDAEQSPRLGLFYVVRDAELGEQSLGVGHEFPVAEDPTLWSVLELVKEETAQEE